MLTFQIAIGCIENIQDPECIDIRFCSRKGACANLKKKLPDELYEDSDA